MEQDRRPEQTNGEHPGVALPPPDAASQHEQGHPGQHGEHGGGLGERQWQHIGDAGQPGAQWWG